MLKILFTIALSTSLILTHYFEASAETTDQNNQFASIQTEKLVVRALVIIQSAQTTYQATTDGNFGLLDDLRQAELIDTILASGEKYGYYFTVYKVDRTATTPAKFYATAIPRLYRKSGRNSFYIDESGELRGADKNGEAATVNDTVIDTCFSGNENCTINDLRTFGNAQATYQASDGGGNFGTFKQLYAAGLINRNMSSGSVHGYSFTCVIAPATATTSASYKVFAVPVNYGTSGIRSFYIDENGVIRAADKNGAPAADDDPPI